MAHTYSLAIFLVLAAVGCGRDKTDRSAFRIPTNNSEGFVNIMPAERSARYKALLPQLEDSTLDSMLHDDRTMWYDAETMVPGYQDSMGDPEGMRPNTIRSSLIDTGSPGGHAALFAEKGRFNFPFGTGGLDESPNAFKINFWSAPRENGNVLPVAYWKLNFSRWRWLFPKDTVIGEVLFVRFPDDELRVFEIRTRTRTLTGWTVELYRPFPTAEAFASALKSSRTSWHDDENLNDVIAHLESKQTLTSYRLATTKFPGTFDTVEGHLDYLPEINDIELVKRLLKETVFVSAKEKVWKQSGEQVTYAASTQSNASIVPRGYQAGVFPVNDEFCARCHVDAGRQIGDFHPRLVLYGELWGEDETFSWHPFETNMFVDSNGRVNNFNDDNRRIRREFQDAKLVAPYRRDVHTEANYRDLPRDWTYNPIN